MKILFGYAVEIMGMIFLVITFIQSGVDKIVDWNGNLTWLKDHFKKTAFRDMVPFLLGVLIVLELLSGILCALGIVKIFLDGTTTMAFYGATFSALALLMLLLGQRIAKDYDGARSITIYFIPALFLMYLLQPQ